MNKEAPGIIHHVLTTREPVGRWETARAVRADQYDARTVFERMRCLVRAGVRLRNGKSKPEQLFRVDRNLIPANCSGCTYVKGICDPTWRDTKASLDIEVLPPDQEGV